jgi:hypothetical protein
MPGYGICCYLMASTTCSVCLGLNLRRLFLNSEWIGCVVATGLFWGHFQLTGQLNEAVKRCFPPKPNGIPKVVRRPSAGLRTD